jgi:hypothetical protein
MSATEFERELGAILRRVVDMRRAQRRWFNGDHSAECLNEAKRLEREIDTRVAMALGELADKEKLL